MTPKRKKQLAKRRQAKTAPHPARLEYEMRLKEELGLEYMGYMRMPIVCYTWEDYKRRMSYFGDWNPKMEKLQRHQMRKYYITLHLRPKRHGGGLTRNGFENANVTKQLTCYPREVGNEVKKLVQILCIEHDVEVNELTSFAVIRS